MWLSADTAFRILNKKNGLVRIHFIGILFGKPCAIMEVFNHKVIINIQQSFYPNFEHLLK